MLDGILPVAAAFNLICSVTYGAATRPSGTPEVFRVDPVAGLYCRDSCQYLHHIDRITPTHFVLKDSWSRMREERFRTVVRREDGAYEGLVASDRRLYPDVRSRGRCRVARFTGFPENAIPVMGLEQ